MRPSLTRRLAVGLVLLAVAGCAGRADWIEGTLVTVDVTGRWSGRLAGMFSSGEVELTTRQAGPRVTGDVRLTIPNAPTWSGPIEGTVSGDVLKFSRPDGRLRGELVAEGDALSGTITFGSGTRSVRLQRQP